MKSYGICLSLTYFTYSYAMLHVLSDNPTAGWVGTWEMACWENFGAGFFFFFTTLLSHILRII